MGGLVASPAHGQESPGAVVPDPVPVTERSHTPAGAGIKVVHARFTNHHRLVRATVVWNKALLAKPGTNDRFNLRVAAVAKGKKAKTTTLAVTTSTVAKRRTQVRFWLSASAARTVRSAKAVVLSLSQQYDSPRDRDKLYEQNYVNAVYLKGVAAAPAGTRDCRYFKIGPGADLSNCALPPIADLRNADLTKVNMSWSTGASVLLSGSQMYRANLTWAFLERTHLERTQLVAADLTGARLMVSYMEDTNQLAADMVGVTLSDSWADRVNFSGANMHRAALDGRFHDGAMINTDLTEAWFHGGLWLMDMRGADLRGARMHGALLYYSTLRAANLTGADLSGTNLKNANLTIADLVETNLEGANLAEADLEDADLTKANLIEANLTKANLTQANMIKANLTDATLHQANLSFAIWPDGRKCAQHSVGRCD